MVKRKALSIFKILKMKERNAYKKGICMFCLINQIINF